MKYWSDSRVDEALQYAPQPTSEVRARYIRKLNKWIDDHADKIEYYDEFATSERIFRDSETKEELFRINPFYDIDGLISIVKRLEKEEKESGDEERDNEGDRTSQEKRLQCVQDQANA